MKSIADKEMSYQRLSNFVVTTSAMHLSRGVYFTLPKVFLFKEYAERYLRSTTAFRDQCDKAAGGSELRICVENSDGYTDFQIKALDILMESKVFALTFDTGHNHLIGGADEPIISARREKLCHFHDAKGRKNHLAMGTGELDLQNYVHMAMWQGGRVVLETKTIDGLKQSVRWMKDQGFGT